MEQIQQQGADASTYTHAKLAAILHRGGGLDAAAVHFGVTLPWLQRIVASDAFQALLGGGVQPAPVPDPQPFAGAGSSFDLSSLVHTA